jgi:hypothetical protein
LLWGCYGALLFMQCTVFMDIIVMGLLRCVNIHAVYCIYGYYCYGVVTVCYYSCSVPYLWILMLWGCYGVLIFMQCTVFVDIIVMGLLRCVTIHAVYRIYGYYCYGVVTVC